MKKLWDENWCLGITISTETFPNKQEIFFIYPNNNSIELFSFIKYFAIKYNLLYCMIDNGYPIIATNDKDIILEIKLKSIAPIYYLNGCLEQYVQGTIEEKTFFKKSKELIFRD